MNDMKLKPDCLFEISWEVCNKVGGINTVIATKARTVCGKYGDRYFTIGPDLGQGADREFEEDPALLKGWRQTLYEKGIRVRVGRWRIVGRAQVILVDFSSLIPRKDDILKFLWESYRVDSISGQWDYIEPVLFGYAAGKLCQRLLTRNYISMLILTAFECVLLGLLRYLFSLMHAGASFLIVLRQLTVGTVLNCLFCFIVYLPLRRLSGKSRKRSR